MAAAKSWPLIVETFGRVKEIHSISDHMTKLNISYDDNYMIQLMHENGNKGILIIDVVTPCAVRKFEVYGEDTYVKWDGVPESVKVFNALSKKVEEVQMLEQSEHRDGYSAFIVENAYKNEIREFMDVVLNGKKPIYGFEQDLDILKLITRIGA